MSSEPIPLGIASHLPPGGLIALIWGGVGLAFIFVIARTAIRFYKVEQLTYDDYWIYFAWIFLTVNAVLQTVQAPHLYYIARAAAGLVPAGEPMVYHGGLYLRYEFASIGLFWTTLWAVKASFLTVFWRLFYGLPMYRRSLVGVAIFSFLTYAGCWIASILNCHPAHLYFQFGQCSKPIDLRGTIIAVSYSTTVDILTDMMIMALPFRLLYTVQITRKQKLGLVGVFGIATIIIVVALIRAVEVTTKARTDGVLLTVWSVIESTVSVIVGCLPPFKSLFSNRTSSSGGRYSSKRTRGVTNPPLNSTTIQRKSSIPLQSYDEGYNARIRAGEMVYMSDSQTEIVRVGDEEMAELGMRGIRVRSDFSFRSSKESSTVHEFEKGTQPYRMEL